MCPLTLSMVLCAFPSVMQTMCFLHPFVLSRAIISFDLPLDLAINSFNEASEVTDQIHVKFPSSSHSFTHSFLPSYVPSFNHSFLPSFSQPFIHSFLHSFQKSFHVKASAAHHDSSGHLLPLAISLSAKKLPPRCGLALSGKIVCVYIYIYIFIFIHTCATLCKGHRLASPWSSYDLFSVSQRWHLLLTCLAHSGANSHVRSSS